MLLSVYGHGNAFGFHLFSKIKHHAPQATGDRSLWRRVFYFTALNGRNKLSNFIFGKHGCHP